MKKQKGHQRAPVCLEDKSKPLTRTVSKIKVNRVSLSKEIAGDLITKLNGPCVKVITWRAGWVHFAKNNQKIIKHVKQ
jgi:hypothetical protein